VGSGYQGIAPPLHNLSLKIKKYEKISEFERNNFIPTIFLSLYVLIHPMERKKFTTVLCCEHI